MSSVGTGLKFTARRAAEKGQKVFVLGIGTPTGGTIKYEDGSYHYDNQGYAVTTKLNEDVAYRIAVAGNGEYQCINNENANHAENFISEHLAKMNQDETRTDVYGGYEELFIFPAILAFILLLLDVIILAFIDLNKRNS